MNLLRTQLRPAIVALLLFTLLTGVLYPLSVTGLAQLFFPRQANGSLITKPGRRSALSWLGRSSLVLSISGAGLRQPQVIPTMPSMLWH